MGTRASLCASALGPSIIADNLLSIPEANPINAFIASRSLAINRRSLATRDSFSSVAVSCCNSAKRVSTSALLVVDLFWRNVTQVTSLSRYCFIDWSKTASSFISLTKVGTACTNVSSRCCTASKASSTALQATAWEAKNDTFYA